MARLFELRKNLLLQEIIHGGLFGRIVGHISVVEYQVCDQQCITLILIIIFIEEGSSPLPLFGDSPGLGSS